MRAHVEIAGARAGSEWRGDMYRCADGTSNPLYNCWSPIGTATPDYHRPEYFGRLIFG